MCMWITYYSRIAHKYRLTLRILPKFMKYLDFNSKIFNILPILKLVHPLKCLTQAINSSTLFYISIYIPQSNKERSNWWLLKLLLRNVMRLLHFNHCTKEISFRKSLSNQGKLAILKQGTTSHEYRGYKTSSALIFSGRKCYRKVCSPLFCLIAPVLAEAVIFSLDLFQYAENLSPWRKLHHFIHSFRNKYVNMQYIIMS